MCVAGDRGLVVAWRLVLLLFGLRSMFALTRCTRLTRCRPAGRETTPDFFCIKQLWAESHILTVYIYYTHTHTHKHTRLRNIIKGVHIVKQMKICAHTHREHPTSSEASGWNESRLRIVAQHTRTDTHTCNSDIISVL